MTKDAAGVAEPLAAQVRRGARVAFWVTGGVVAALVGTLAIGAGISAIVADRPTATLKHVGVARVKGDLVIYGCEDGGIGAVELQRGDAVDGPLVWSAEKTTGSSALKALAIGADAPGYSVRGTGLTGLALDQPLAIRRITDSHGVNLLRSYLSFRPAALLEGSVALQNGHSQTLSVWLAATPGC